LNLVDYLIDAVEDFVVWLSGERGAGPGEGWDVRAEPAAIFAGGFSGQRQIVLERPALPKRTLAARLPLRVAAKAQRIAR
jgi:hypothetical protein